MRSFLAAVGRRLASALPAVAGVVVVTFVLMRVLPGDPASLLASSPTAGEAEVAEIRGRLGLDKSIPTQFLIYLEGLARGDLGRSVMTGQPVAADLAQRLPASLELVVTAFALALVTALPLGVMAALRPGSVLDHAVRLVATLGVAVPTFVTGLLLVYVFYYLLGWAPDPTGRLDIFLTPPEPVTGLLLVDATLAGNGAAVRSAAGHLVLPAVTLALFVMAPLLRITRTSMLGVMGSDFIRAARAAGLSRWRVVAVYGLGNALLPVLTASGLVVSMMLGASVLVETVFAWPGIASYSVDAMMAGDFAAVQGFVLLMAGIYVVVNLAIDLLYGVLDPRVRLA
ncbi:peptide/nickel transport system permease protein [Amorphus orientalis]|uniref:Peptide/nickel transport system permease protein n=2 Tax=Amorphus orientalis TaxID=649198 RepID=A0AAE3VMV1_9HYPH|nr:peptide/nickel transport system permease protein [Amorphus orientalis]